MGMLCKPTPVPYPSRLPSWRQPLYLHLRPLWLALGRTLGTCEGRLLDIGCGAQPYRELLVPLVNLVCRALDGLVRREDSALCWFVDGTRKQ